MVALNLTAGGHTQWRLLRIADSLIWLNAASGAASGALTDAAIDDHFMKQLTATFTSGSSTLLVLVRTRVFSIHPCQRRGSSSDF